MSHDILAVVDELFRRELQVPDINHDVPLVDYGLDSIRSINLIVEMESRFDVHISDEQAASMQTLREVVDQVTASLAVTVGHGDGDA
ncbi:acyl carrier protein [Streptomyces sp. NPDC048603]|uniref:acyl carrier protein n=1 Tax=Streptomyces sp. NPDC048603 TaxID=3365577 RepID=UPI0037185D9E